MGFYDSSDEDDSEADEIEEISDIANTEQVQHQQDNDQVDPLDDIETQEKIEKLVGRDQTTLLMKRNFTKEDAEKLLARFRTRNSLVGDYNVDVAREAFFDLFMEGWQNTSLKRKQLLKCFQHYESEYYANERARFIELLDEFHANHVLLSQGPLSPEDAEEVFNKFRTRNNLGGEHEVPIARDHFLAQLTKWKNTPGKRKAFLAICDNYKAVYLDKQRSQISLETFKRIYRRCVGDFGKSFKLSKERILERLREEVGPRNFKAQKNKIAQIFRESLQLVDTDNGKDLYVITR